jgi:hypothetical protein
MNDTISENREPKEIEKMFEKTQWIYPVGV